MKIKIKRNMLCFIGLIILLFLSFFVSLFMGRYFISPHTLIEAVKENLFLKGQDEYALVFSVVFNIRLPRTILSMLIGAALAVSGAAFQGLFRNPLVSPDILGVSSGAGFGAVLGILLAGISIITSAYAFIFGLVSVFLAYLLSKLQKDFSIISLILSGMITASVFSSLISLVKYIADPYDKLPAITYWLMGSFSKVTYGDIKITAIPIIAGIIVLILLRWRINLLSLGDEEASSLGIEPKKIRLLCIVLATIITSISVTVVGVIGWVGLVIPHIGRRVVGVDHKDLLPASALLGGVFLTVVDIIARSATSVEIPIGILTALIGAPFFAFLLIKTKKSKGDW